MTPRCARPDCDRARYHGQPTPLCYEHALVAGHVEHNVTNEEVARFLGQWTRLGYSPLSLILSAGMSRGTYSLFAAGGGMRAKTFKRLTANVDPRACMSTPGWMVQRRLVTLRGAGWSMDELAAETGVSRSSLNKIVLHAPRFVTRRVAEPVMALWDEHRNDPVRTPTPWARKAKFPTPYQWDAIDNPDEGHGPLEPVTPIVPALSRRQQEEL